MAAAVESARAVTLEAARRRDRGLPFSRQASIAKLVATDAAMKVTTDAVQVLGGFGYTKEFPVERHDARGQGDADLRGDQPDPAPGDRPPPARRLTRGNPEAAREIPNRQGRNPLAAWGCKLTPVPRGGIR